MWLQRLEYRAREVIERAQTSDPVEDDLVECKREWPEPSAASRRIAAHANAARGEPILWIIGLDEASGDVHDVGPNEMANWWPQVERCFDEHVAPEMQHVFVQTEHGRIAALRFETTRAPYVIRTSNQKFSREVPWRAGTRTRSARRSELLKILVPVATTPDATLVELRVTARLQREREADDVYDTEAVPEHINLYLAGTVYINPPPEPIALPDHAMNGSIDWNPRMSRKTAPPAIPIEPLRLRNQTRFVGQGYKRVEAHPAGVEHRHGSVYVNGAGEMAIDGRASLPPENLTGVKRTQLMRVQLNFPVAGGGSPMEVQCLARRDPSEGARERLAGVWVMDQEAS